METNDKPETRVKDKEKDSRNSSRSRSKSRSINGSRKEDKDDHSRKDVESQTDEEGGHFKPVMVPVEVEEANGDSDESEGSSVSNASKNSTASLLTRLRKRTRPMPEGVSKRKALRKKQGDKQTGAKVKQLEVEAVNAPCTVNPEPQTREEITMEELVAEMPNKPTSELGECISQQLQAVIKVANTSGDLSTSFAEDLRKAVKTIQAATLELAQRTCPTDNVERLERENQELRTELAELSTKVDMLTKEMGALRRQNEPKLVETTTRTANTVTRKGGSENLLESLTILMEQKFAALEARLPLAQPTKSDQIPADAVQESGAKKGKRGGKRVKRTQQQQTVPPQSVASTPSDERAQTESSVAAPEQPWSTVIGRKQKRAAVSNPRPATMMHPPRAIQPPKLPDTAAISVTIPEGSDTSIAAVMAAAKQRIKLAECGLESVVPRKAITGAIILEVSGPDCSKKADVLAQRMREVLSDMEVKIARPMKMGEIRVADLDESVTSDEVAQAVAETGSCSIADVKVGEIRHSKMRLGTVWVKCPLAVVQKLTAAGRVQVGWTSAKVEALAARPLQCFKCLEIGHVRSQCTNTVDRSSLCYSCGDPGHKARDCTASTFKCPVCSDLGLSANHRMGTKLCMPSKPKKRDGRRSTLAQPNSQTTRPTEAMKPSSSHP